MLKTRFVTALVLLCVLGPLLFYVSKPVFFAVVTLYIGIASAEWARLSGLERRHHCLYGIASAALFLLVADGIERWALNRLCLGIFMSAGVLWCVVVPLCLKVQPNCLCGPSTAPRAARNAHLFHGLRGLLGWLVLFPGGLALLILHAGERGEWRVLATMAIAWVSDTAAYFVGKQFGRHKLAPSISPGKTWEGAAGAVSASILYALLLPQTLFLQQRSHFSTVLWLSIVILLTVFGIIADLFESFLKRGQGLKDSGRLLPGHGGLLDRSDSLLAILPLMALIYLYPSPAQL